MTDTSATDFDLNQLGGADVVNGLNKFALSMWIRPNPPILNGPVYTLFRVTTDVSDVIPLTTVITI